MTTSIRIRKTPVLAFPKVGRLGSVFASLCSWLVPVLVTLKVKSSVHGAPIVMKFRGRTQNYLSTYNEKLAIEDVGWRFFKRRFRSRGVPEVLFRCAGLELDYAPCLLKAIANESNTLIGFRAAARRLGLGRPVYFGRWLSPDFRRGLSGVSPALRALVGFRQWLGEMASALGSLALTAGQIGIALFSLKRDGTKIRTLWLGIGTNEFGRLGQKRSFYWPERLGRELEILYVLPRVPKPHFRSELAQDGVRWSSQFHLLQFCDKSQLIRAALKVAWTACLMFVPWRGSLRWRARMSGLHFESLAWSALAATLRIELAVTSSSNWRSTRPILVLLKHAGAKTALWYFAANAVRFQHPGGSWTANGRFKAYHEADRIYVWNRHSRDWIHRNLCHSPENEMRVIGPVMNGDASLRMNARGASQSRTWISIFDVSMPSGGQESFFGALNLPENYYQTFWNDMIRLVRDIPELGLILKPKKSLKSAKRTFTDSFWSLLNDTELLTAGRLELVDDDADPYLAIARCDAAIGMPFTSPCQAAMHSGKTGIYYDPTGIVAVHHFGDLGRFFCRSYEEIATLIREVVENKVRGGAPLLPERVSTFAGSIPGSDPQEVFLKDLSDWIGEPASGRVVLRRETSEARELVGA